MPPSINPAQLRIRHPDQINIDWAQRILAQHSTQTSAQSVKVHHVDIGTTTRIHVEVTHNDAHIPQRWFVKIPSLSLKSRMITALPRFLHKEVCFYRGLAHRLPVRVPQVLATTSEFGLGSTLVMADLTTQSATPGKAGMALTFEQAQQVVTQLAKLHTQHWQDTSLRQQHRWLNDWSQQMETHMGSLMAVPLMQRGLTKGAEWIAADLHRPALNYAAQRRHAKRFLSNATQTLVHYDCHPGNLFWDEHGPGFLDWQLVRLGEGIGDVAYFLATALDTTVRRQHERELVNQYVDQLKECGINDLNHEQMFARYQAHLVYPFEAMVVTLSIGDMMDEASNIEMIKRSAAAVADHDSFARIRYP